MPISNSPYGRGQVQQSCWDRVKVGFAMGFCVGCASGLIFGGIGSLRAGLRGIELMKQTSKVMVQGGGTFGVFMSVGTALRC